MKSLQVITLGCSKNTVDTSHLLYKVKDDYKIVPESYDGPVDYLLLNTCGFIGDAKEESIAAILQAVERKGKGDVGKLGVFGCLSQRYMADLPSEIPEVDFWGGARELSPIIKFLGGRPSGETFYERWRDDNLPYAYMKISEGCDRRCSYCAIPYIRGAHRSVPMETLVKEAEALAASGVKELILIAQDTTYYGLDIYRKRALGQLLDRLSEIDGIEWIRIHYSYPADFPEDVLDQMRENPKVCRYMDIPLQHVADKVLANMHRNVDGAWTRKLIRTMREKVPGIVLRTTMIVGHPGEGEEEFQELLDFVNEAKFERLGAFEYSEEEGTFGAKHFEDSIPPEVKRERLDRLMEAQQKISLAYNESRVGSEVKVLVDGAADGRLVCRSEFESPEVDGEIIAGYDSGFNPSDVAGKFCKVTITGADDYDLIARI